MASSNPTGAIVGLSIGAIMVATLGMTAFQQLFAANTTGVDATVVLLAQTVVGIVIGVAFIILFLRHAGIKIS